MEGWVKIGVQRASVLYPNSCYNELCYIEVQVYISVRKASKSNMVYSYGKEFAPREQILSCKS